MGRASYSFLEFFAGGGMARLGLGENWRCRFANDLDPMKCAAYRVNFGAADLVESSIEDLTLQDLPNGRTDLAWASFPCQDLSLAGARGGIAGKRSGLFFAFWRLIEALAAEARAPRLVVIENVAGLASSNDGRDLAEIGRLMTAAGYAVRAGVVDAATFTPQSRPRLFIVGFHGDAASAFSSVERPRTQLALPPPLAPDWAPLPLPATRRNTRLDDIIDWDNRSWDAKAKTAKLLAMMSPLQRARLETLIKTGERRAGAGFRRMRIVDGVRMQRFEARFDGLAGCLRTPAGGSSRQILVTIRDGEARTRLMSPAEAARLMGLPEDYILPEGANAALKLCGDGVSVPVVRWLAETVLEPALAGAGARAA